MQKTPKPNNAAEYKGFDAVVMQDYILYDFGQVGQEILRQDQTELYRLIDESVQDIQARHNYGLQELIYKLKNSIVQHFASRPLYVLFEKELNCNVETDHLAPKNVYPLYGPFLERLFDEVYNFVRAFVCHELVLSADKINSTARRIMTETLETNELLLVKLLFNQQESQKFKDLFDTNVTKFVNQEQNLKRYIQTLREQVRQASVIGRQFQADFGREKNAALEYKDNVVFSTDRLRQLQARNLYLEKEVVRLSGELDKLRSSEDRLQSFAKHAIEVEYAFYGAQNEMTERTLLLQQQNARINELVEQDEARYHILELFEQRLIMYRDDPADVAANAVEYLDDDKLAEKFAPRPECREYDVITELRLYDLGNIDSLQRYISYLESELSRYEGGSAGRFDLCDKCVYVDDAFSKQQTATLRLYYSQILSFYQKADDDRKELERLSYLIQQRAEQLEDYGGMQQYARALSAGLRSLRVRDVECQTDIEEVAVFDHAERLQGFVAQNEELIAEVEKYLAYKAQKKEARQKAKERYGADVKSGFELLFRNLETGRLYDHNYCPIAEERQKNFERKVGAKSDRSTKAPLYSENLGKPSYQIDSKTRAENAKISSTSGSLDVNEDKEALGLSDSAASMQEAGAVKAGNKVKPKRTEELCFYAGYEYYQALFGLDAMVDRYFMFSEAEKADFQSRIKVYDGFGVSKAVQCDSPVGQDKATYALALPQKYAKYDPDTGIETNLSFGSLTQQYDTTSKGQVFTFMDAYLDKQRNYANRSRNTAELGAETVLQAAKDNLSRDYANVSASYRFALGLEKKGREFVNQRKALVKQLPDDETAKRANLRYLQAVNEYLPKEQQIDGTESIFDTFYQLRLGMQQNEGRRDAIIAEAYELYLQYWKKVFTAQELHHSANSAAQALIPIELRTSSRNETTSAAQSLLPGINFYKVKASHYANLRYTDVEPSLKTHRHYLLNVRAASTDISLSKSARLPDTSLSASRGMVGRALSQKK